MVVYAEPVTAEGSGQTDDRLNAGEFTVMEQSCAVVAPWLSIAKIRNGHDTAAVGVPEMEPSGVKANPTGSCPNSWNR